MISPSRFPRHVIAIGILTSLSLLVPAQTPAPPHVIDTHFPVGRWVAEHPSKAGIGSWWEFRADGTLTMYFGAMVDDHIDRSGNTFIMSSGMTGGEHVRAQYTIRNDILSADTGPSQPSTYSRIGTMPNPTDPLVGSWRPLPRATDAGGSPDQVKNRALMQTVMVTKGMLIFTPDGMQYLRVPIGTREGTWDDHANSFRLENDSVTYAFGRMNSRLVLGQMPSGRDMDSFVPDPLPLVATGVTPPADPDPRTGVPSAEVVPRQGPGIVMPKITRAVEASFSDEARARRIGGTVRLEVIIEADGRLRTARVVRSAAEAYSDPADREAARTLDLKALEAVWRYSFAPGTSHDKPVPTPVPIEVNFYLR